MPLILVILPSNDEQWCKQLCSTPDPATKSKVVVAGPTVTTIIRFIIVTDNNLL